MQVQLEVRRSEPGIEGHNIPDPLVGTQQKHVREQHQCHQKSATDRAATDQADAIAWQTVAPPAQADETHNRQKEYEPGISEQ